MSNPGELGKNEEAANPGEQQMGLTRFSPVRKLVQRVGRRMELVTQLLHEESGPDGLTAEQERLPAGTLRKFGGVECVWCPPGQFMMGSPDGEEGRCDDEAQHVVTLTRGFWMSSGQVTQAEYTAMLGVNPSLFEGLDRPVEHVSWDEAVEYCRKLTAKLGGDGLLPEGWEWRLPTEAEWEYAARAGTTCARYGDLFSIAWFDGNSGGESHPVKEKVPNAWGLCDMIGNVWEWCSDWHGKYPAVSVTDPTGSGSGPCRVSRGGDTSSDAGEARAANRCWCPPSYRSLTGFRPTLSLVRPQAYLTQKDSTVVSMFSPQEHDSLPRAQEAADSGAKVQLAEQTPVGICPTCKCKVFEGLTAWFCERTQADMRKCKFKLERTILSQTVDRSQVEKLLRDGRTDAMGGFLTKAGRYFTSYLVVGQRGRIEFEFPEQRERYAR
jgi:formylglycine-generating enzyme required for sulfatase activity